MENKVGIRELKQNPSTIIERVKAGEDFTVTERGVPVGRLTGLTKSVLLEMMDSGEATGPTKNLGEIISTISPFVLQDGAQSTKEWLDWSRGEQP
jgi:prevent-host-death family protein